MAQRYFNWTLAIVLVVGVVVLVAAALSLHKWQRSTLAEEALPLGEQAFAEQNWEEAAKQIGRYLTINGDDLVQLLRYGQAQEKIRPNTSNNIQQAIAAYSTVLRLDAGNVEAAKRLIAIYLSGSPGEAELKARQFLEHNDDPTIRQYLGVALIQQRDFRQAQQTLARLIHDHPDHVAAYEVMGLLAAEQPAEVNQPANYWFEEAVRANPQSALAYLVRGSFLRRSGDHADAIADFERAASLDLSDREVHLRLIAELILAGAYDQARAQIAALRATTPREPDLWRYWAMMAIQSNSEQEMQTVAEAGLNEMAAYPWDFLPWAAELLIRSKRFEQATDCILQMRKKDVEPARTAFLEGYLAQQKGQLQEAATFWRKAIALGYQSRRDRTWRGHFPPVRMFLASVLQQMGDLHAAIEQLRLLVSDMPDVPQFHLALAQLLAQAEDWPGVLEQALQVQRLVPEPADGKVPELRSSAALLEIQARMRMVAGAGDSESTRGAWSSLEARLAELSKVAADPTQVELLRVQAAMFQGRHAEAAAMLAQLEKDQKEGYTAALLRAQLYVDEGKGPEAVSLLRQTVERFPQSTEPVRHLALLLNRQNDRSQCDAVVRDAMSRMDKAGRRSLGMLLADLYASWDRNEPLYGLLTDLSKEFPEDIEAKRRLLTLDRVLKDPALSQSLVDQIKSIEGQDGWQWRVEQARVWILSEGFQSYYGQIVRLLQENLLVNPEDRASRLLLAAAYEKAGDLQLALATYREAIQRWPNDIGVVTRTVQALYQAGEDEEAQEILDRAKSRDLYDPDIQRLQLQGYLRRSAMASDSAARRDALVSASDILQNLVRQDPNDTAAGLRLVAILGAQKKYDEAQAALNAVKAKDPDSVSVLVAQVQLDVERGDADAALRLCGEAIARQDSVFARLLRGRTYEALQRYDQARADYDQMVALEPEKAEVWMSRSDFFLRTGRLAEAIADIEKALELAADSLPAQQRALFLFFNSGDPVLFQRAEVLLEKALQVHPQDTGLQLQKARALLRHETAPAAEQARTLLREITEKNPNLAEAWELLGMLELREDQLARAMDVVLRGLAENPNNRQLLLLKAQAEARRSPMLAVPTLKGLIDQDPNDMNAVSQLAYAYLYSDRPQEAVRLLRQHLGRQTGPARKQGEIALATVLYRTGEPNEAAEIVRGLMQAEPADSSLVIMWAGLLLSAERWTEVDRLLADWRAKHPDDTAVAIAVARSLIADGRQKGLEVAERLLRSEIERHPQALAPLHLLANLATVTGRSDEAIALNQKIREIDPDDVFALNNLAWLLCEEQRQYQKALELANRGLQLRPEYIDLLETRGVIYHRLGRLDEAVQDLSRSLELYPVNAAAMAPTHFHLARVYAEMGREADAIRHVEQALALHRRSRQSTDPGRRRSELSEKDLADAERLLDQLKKGNG
ncbi:MAG TPA: tetratricopeptide repeat protein [Sedimentisphaerales bacterium]|mgnify:CR=1 FL=1|nr:tetratricopeptide repeat protein [Sedimentisphaerales bacterium]HRS10178.1 tetratricopeptide repeat protein [Sedimentisphaerales bacterium]HRV46884.1 tetratricopeptide repeat protein [Sedimentisphaerales bacterium]